MEADLLVLLARHAEREFQPGLPDREQPLTYKGKRACHALGQKLRQALTASAPNEPSRWPVSIIFHSPYLRCQQTATILSEYLEPKAGQHSAEALIPEAPEAVRWSLNLLGSNLEVGSLMLVAHQPELIAISQRLCDTPLQLKTGEVAALQIRAQNGLWKVGNATLEWRIKG